VVPFDSVFAAHFGEPMNVVARLIPVIVDRTIVGMFGVARWPRSGPGEALTLGHLGGTSAEPQP
jgi:hypothetical protein